MLQQGTPAKSKKSCRNKASQLNYGHFQTSVQLDVSDV